MKLAAKDPKEPVNYPIDKPTFQLLSSATTLQDLVNPDCFMFFSILGVGWEWMRVLPDQWENKYFLKCKCRF